MLGRSITILNYLPGSQRDLLQGRKRVQIARIQLRIALQISIKYSTLFILIYSCLTFSQSPNSVKGIVIDDNSPIAGAIVRWQASNTTVITDANGNFELEILKNRSSNLITAWKQGYYNGGTEYINGVQNIEIKLAPLPETDNTSYEWIDPVPNPDDEIDNCGDCHASIIYDQWVHNGHAQSAINPLFLSIYNGTDSTGKFGVQPGYKIDYPHSQGNCANCHAPTRAVNNVIGIDLNNLNGVEKLGVSCDFCHKIKGVKLKENTSVFTGVMHYELIRPPDGHQIFFGPYHDVPDPDTYSNNISKSIFCAPCHQGGYWGVPIYESYTEWLQSSYAAQGIECQTCHMPPDGITTNFAPGKGGVERDPSTIPTHLQLGSRDKDFLASAVEVRSNVSIVGSKLNVIVEVENVGAGHHVPTDQPMRNMILIVEATDSEGKKLKYSGQNLIPLWGGRGELSEGNYEGQPGKGFAKILFEDWTPYLPYKISTRGEQMFPAPQWRTIKIKEDTRIAALATDVSNYEFQLGSHKGPYTVKCKLIYRRMFKNWAALKKWNLDDIILSEKILNVNQQKNSMRVRENN